MGTLLAGHGMLDGLWRILEATSDGFVALDADWHYVNEHAGRMESV